LTYDFNVFVDRNNTNSAKWEFMQLMDPEATDSTLPLWVADMDFPCAKPILDALHERVDRQIFGYSAHNTGEYYRAVCGWYQHRFNWYVNSSDLVYSPGVVPAIGYLIEILTQPGDGIIIQRPVYYPFTNMINSHSRKIVNNPLVNHNGYYEMDFEDLENKAKNPNTKMLIFCSPHNPVGRVWKEEELKRLGQICLDNGLIIVSDEIHYDLVKRGLKHIPLVTLFPEHKNRIISCTAPSKTFNLAGMQLSNIVIHDEEIRNKWNEYVVGQLGIFMPNSFSIVAAQAAYTYGEDWLEQVIDYVDGNKHFVQEFLKEHLPKAKYSVPEGTYLLWVDLSDYGHTQEQLEKVIHRDSKVLTDMGVLFGEEGKGFIRLNAACTRAILKEALERIAGAVNKLKKGDKAPDFVYDTPWKKEIRLSEKVKEKTTFLYFLRYYGCTLCQLEIADIIENYHKFIEKNAQMLVVLQSDPALIREQVKGELPFDIVCDPEQKLFKLYQVRPAVSMEDALSARIFDKVRIANERGLKHGKYEGNELQLPALFLVDSGLTVRYVHYSKEMADLLTIDDMVELV